MQTLGPCSNNNKNVVQHWKHWILMIFSIQFLEPNHTCWVSFQNLGQIVI